MSRNASGTYSLPSGNPVVSGTTIQASWANTTLNDIANALTDSLSRSGSGGMSAGLVGIQGSAVAPAYTFASDLTTGIFRAAAGAIGFAGGGVERMRLNADGALGLGAVASATTLFRLGRNISGGVGVDGIRLDGVIQSGVTSTYSAVNSIPATQAAAFTLTQLNHFRAMMGTIGPGSTVAEINGFLADPTMVGAGTLNTGFRGAIPNAAANWNLYCDGSAPNYMLNTLRVGTSVSGGSPADRAGVEAGKFVTYETTVGTASGIAQNVFNLPNVDNATWILSCGIASVDAPNYSEVVMVATAGATASASLLVNGALASFTFVGLLVQVTQNSGAPANINVRATRIA